MSNHFSAGNLEFPGDDRRAVRQALGDVARDMCLAFGYVDPAPGPDLKWVYPRIAGLGSRHGHVFAQVANEWSFREAGDASA